MNQKPSSFKLPLSKFDLNLLPPSARQIGSEEFKTAVVAYFALQYAAKQQQAVVSVDDEEISVLVLPADSNPLDFVLTMLQSGRIQEAIPFLEALVKTDANNTQVLYNLGIAYSEVGQFDEAIIRLKRTVQFEPKNARAWTGIGVAYQRLGNSAQAMEAMKNAVQADPTDGYSRRNFGAMLMNAGQMQEALLNFRAARKALPHDAQTLYGLACVLDEIGGNAQKEEADELYLVVIEKFPGSQLAELARKARTKIAHQSMRSQTGANLRPDVVMFISGALDTFAKVGLEKTKQITFEIALKGQDGLDINDPQPKYTLKSLPGQFSGLHLVSIMYTGMKQIDPNMDSGIDLSNEYEAAKKIQPK